MEYAVAIDDIISKQVDVVTQAPETVDGVYGSDLYTKYQMFSAANDCLRRYFSRDTVRMIQTKVTQLTRGVDPHNRPIVVPEDKILHVMDAIYNTFRPPTGDIYSRYNVPTGTTSESYVQSMIDQTIEIVVSDIRISLGTEQQNEKLSAWTTVLGDFNDQGLRSYAPIKLKVRRPNPMQFNMNY